MTHHELTRRAFIAASTTTVLSACSTGVNTAKVVLGKVSPNERLNIATVGMGMMGRGRRVCKRRWEIRGILRIRSGW